MAGKTARPARCGGVTACGLIASIQRPPNAGRAPGSARCLEGQDRHARPHALMAAPDPPGMARLAQKRA